MYKPGDTIYAEFITSNDRGVAADADSLPVATARRNGADGGTSPTGWSNTLVVTNIDTGRYQVTGLIPVGYAAGDGVNITVAATVDGEAGKAVVFSCVLTAANIDDVVTDIAALPDDADITTITNAIAALPMDADVETACEAGLADYGAATATNVTDAHAATDADIAAAVVEINANETKIDALQVDSTAIKAKTDNLPSDPADASVVAGLIGGLNNISSSDVITACGTALASWGKTGFALSTAGIKAIWDQLISALTTVGSIGKLLSTFTFTGTDVKATLDGETVVVENAAATYNGPINDDGDITIYQDDDYSSSRTIGRTITGYSGDSLSGCTAKLRLLAKGEYETGSTTVADMEVTATVSQDGTTVTWSAVLTPANKADLEAVPRGSSPNHEYQVIATTAAPNSKVITIDNGDCTVRKSLDTIPVV